MKIVILILSSNTYPSKRNKKAIQKTWANQNYPNTDIYFYSAGTKTKIIDRDLIIKDSGTAQDIGKKTLSAFDWVDKNREYDFIFRTNTSSFINLKKLEAYINENKNNLDYSGVVLDTKQQIKIASGAGYFISRKNIELIINNKDEFDINFPDDVAVAKLMKENNIFPINTIREDLNEATTPKDLIKILKPKKLFPLKRCTRKSKKLYQLI